MTDVYHVLQSCSATYCSWVCIASCYQLCMQMVCSYCLICQDDWDSYVAFTPKVGKKVQVVGDDLTVTNPIR